jgi:4-amino-4-deoxy-L-arabinose transferase-like glycosyltransferase
MTSLAEAAARRPGALLAGLALVVSFAFQGSRGLYESTEGRYAETALEMVQRGELLEPTLAGRPHWTKPPMAYWPIAAGIAVAGPNGWGARLANAVALCLTVLLVAGCGAALWDRTTGLVAGLVYATSPFPVGGAWALSADTVLAFFEVLAVFLYLRARRDAGTRRARWLVRAMWIAWGLAFLTKGPVGLLPLLAVFPFERRAPHRAPLGDPAGLALFAIVAFSWYAWEGLRHPGLLTYYVRDEVIGRTVSNEFQRNPQWWKPFALYLPALVVGQGAWLVFGARIFRRERLLAPSAAWARLRGGGTGSFLLLWLALPLAVLFLSSSRLTFYVLPLYAPIALAVARAAVVGLAPAAALRRAARVALPSSLVLVLAKGAAAYAAPLSAKDMGRLYATVRKVAGPGAEVRVYGERELFGLQFYLGGRLRRVSREGSEPWADERLDDALAAMGGARDRGQVLVSPAGDVPALEAALVRAGLPHRRVAAARRELFLVEPRAAERLGAR